MKYKEPTSALCIIFKKKEINIIYRNIENNIKCSCFFRTFKLSIFVAVCFCFCFCSRWMIEFRTFFFNTAHNLSQSYIRDLFSWQSQWDLIHSTYRTYYRYCIILVYKVKINNNTIDVCKTCTTSCSCN